MLTLAELGFGDAGSNISNAHRVIDQFGGLLRSDQVVATRLVCLADLLSRLGEQMSAIGLPGLCRTCGQGPRGGCCFADMADEADVALLTINLLLSGGITSYRRSNGECRFLGLHGCTLRCKPVFCLSYSCPQMHEKLSGRDLAALDRACSEVLCEQLALEERIRDLALGRP